MTCVPPYTVHHPRSGWAWYCTRHDCDAYGCGYPTDLAAIRAARTHAATHVRETAA